MRVCIVMLSDHISYSDLVGSSPHKRRYAVSRKLLFSASCSIGYPRYLRIPLSPSMYVMVLLQAAVLRSAGSYVIMPKSSGCTLICRRSIARMVSCAIGISYCFPVRLSVTVREFWPFVGVAAAIFSSVLGAFEFGMHLLLNQSRCNWLELS